MPRASRKLGTECSKLTKLKECVRIGVDESQHAILLWKKHICVVPQESQTKVLRRGKIPWGIQFRREDACNSYEYLLPSASDCRVPIPSVSVLRSKEPGVGQRKLQGSALELTHPAANAVLIFLKYSRVDTPGNYFHRRLRVLSTSALLKPTPYPAALSIIKPIQKYK